MYLQIEDREVVPAHESFQPTHPRLEAQEVPKRTCWGDVS